MKFLLSLIKFGILTAFLIVMFIVYKENTLAKPDGFDSIIVLGAQVKEDGSLSNQLLLRLKKTMEVYQKKNCLIVCSGAKGVNEPISEGTAMKEWLIKNGVNSNNVIEEVNSYSTQENIGNSLELLKQRGLSQPVIITSDYHLPRALAIASDIGIKAQGYPSETLPEFWLKNHTREALAWLKYLANKIIKGIK